MSTPTSLLKDVRQLYARLIKDMTEEQLTKVPEGFSNNILWNVGHVVVTQQRLTYGLAGQQLNTPEEMLGLYRKGTSPNDWQETPEVEPLKTMLVELPEIFQADYQTDMFQNFKEYQSTTGPLLKTIDDGVAFNDFHEGLHLGVILSLKKLV